MNQERVVFFLDYANINRAAHDCGVDLKYGDLLAYMGEGRFLVDAHAYVPVDPRNEHAVDRVIERLWEEGYVVRAKVGTTAGATYKCDFDVEITMDVLRTVYQVRPDIIVLATGDSDFVPLVQEVRTLGVRVEVASFSRAASKHLRLRSSGFISLDKYVEDAIGEEPPRADVVAEPTPNADIQQEEAGQDVYDGDLPIVDAGGQKPSSRGEPRIPHPDD